MPQISLYKNAADTRSEESLDIDDFVKKIKEGYWQDKILHLRTLKDKTEQDTAKKRLPMVTVSGLFPPNQRNDKSIQRHSGFIQIDIDALEDVEDTKSFIYTDEYVYCGFTSSRGYGLCLIFRINPKRHRDAFAGISEYLYKKYHVIVDQTSVNESRGRFVSFDPNLHYNHDAIKFEIYPEKKKPEKIPTIIYAQGDFENILQQIQNRNIDLTASYHEWLRIGFAIADKFGEGGRQYFHIISSNNSEYNHAVCDRQYNACVKSNRTGVTIATLYYYAKQAGIETISKETKQITQAAIIAKKSGKDKESTVKLLKKDGIKGSDKILEQIFDNNIQVKDEENLVTRLQIYLKQNHTLKRNIITRRIEVDERILDDTVFNNIWCESCKVFDKGVTSEMLKRILNSDFIPSYNPFADFFEKYRMRKPKGVIDQFIECVETDAGVSYNEFYPDYANYFVKKWIVSVISAMHYIHSPLMLVLVGGQNTGKTQFFRRFLPPELQSYYGEISTGMKDTDFHIMMCQKLIVLDDEMESRTKAESKTIKHLTSKDIFTVREPYGTYNIDLKRLAVMCANNNDPEILTDKTGNRRVIPWSVLSIDYDAINQIDRVDVLMEAYWLWKSGFDWQMSKEDITTLEKNTQRFVEIAIEQELVIEYFRKPNPGEISFHMMPTEIKSHVERHSQQRTSKKNIIAVMRNLGYEYVQKRVNGTPVWGFSVMRILQNSINNQ